MRRTATDRKYEAARARQITEEVARIRPVSKVALSLCEYDKNRKVLKLASEYCGMPRELFIESGHTGRVIRFVSVGPEDVLFDQDQWDGEQQIYRPADGELKARVDHLVIYNQY